MADLLAAIDNMRESGLTDAQAHAVASSVYMTKHPRGGGLDVPELENMFREAEFDETQVRALVEACKITREAVVEMERGRFRAAETETVSPAKPPWYRRIWRAA